MVEMLVFRYMTMVIAEMAVEMLKFTFMLWLWLKYFYRLMEMLKKS